MNAEPTSLVPRQDYAVELRNFENALLAFITHLGLPGESVLVSVNERGIVFKNIEDVVVKIDGGKKGGSIYISKFIATKKAQGIKLGRPKGPGKSKLDVFSPEIESLPANGSTQKFIAGRYKTTEANLHNWLSRSLD